MTFTPVEGGGCLILNRQESIPVFFKTTVKAYVQPSLSTPKSTSSGCSKNPLTAPTPLVEEVCTLRRTGSSTTANYAYITVI